MMRLRGGFLFYQYVKIKKKKFWKNMLRKFTFEYLIKCLYTFPTRLPDSYNYALGRLRDKNKLRSY